MLSRIFPRQIDNTYRGHRLAIWLFALIVLAKLLMGANAMLNTRVVATSADGIPLDSYGAQAAATVIAFFAVWGLGALLLALQGIMVLIRYRGLIPFMYLLLLTEQLGRKALLFLHPIAKPGTLPVGVAVNLALLGMLLIGLVLSLLRSGPPERDRPI